MTNETRERERANDLILSETELGGVFRLILPHELESAGRSHYTGYNKPGVWLIAKGKGRSPAAHPIVEGRLLDKQSAIQLAHALDAVCLPRPHFARNDYSPRTYADFLNRWYALLADRLPVAIEAAENRRTELRELRAALTGEVI